MVAFILWTFTLIAGAIWAKQAWGAYWQWDPKEVWTFVIWTVYAAYMHSRATAGIDLRKSMYIALAGFVCRHHQLHARQSRLDVRRHAQLLGDVTVVRYTASPAAHLLRGALPLWLVGIRNNPVLLLRALGDHLGRRVLCAASRHA